MLNVKLGLVTREHFHWEAGTALVYLKIIITHNIFSFIKVIKLLQLLTFQTNTYIYVIFY